MDFSLTDDQESLRTLAADIFGDKATPERVEAVENSAERFDRELWRELAEAGLLGIALPEAVGGAGLGLVELALVCEQHGQVVAPVPLAWTTTRRPGDRGPRGCRAAGTWARAAASGAGRADGRSAGCRGRADASSTGRSPVRSPACRTPTSPRRSWSRCATSSTCSTRPVPA